MKKTILTAILAAALGCKSNDDCCSSILVDDKTNSNVSVSSSSPTKELYRVYLSDGHHYDVLADDKRQAKETSRLWIRQDRRRAHIVEIKSESEMKE